MASELLFVRTKRERQVRQFATFLGHCALAFVLTGCGGSGGSTEGGGAGTPPSGASTTVSSITLTPPAPSIQAGHTQQFAATAMDANGNGVPNVTFTWTSNNQAVTSVSGGGLATGVSAGTATITAAIGSVNSNPATLTVTPSPVQTITLTPATASPIQVGQTAQFTATATDGNNQVMSNVSFNWTSSPAGVVTISASGLATGVSAGATTITAAIGSVNSNPATLTVTPSPVQTITLTPATASPIQVGQTAQFTATATDGNNQVMSNVSFNWTSSPAGVVTISASGLATGVSAGATTITAAIGSVNSNPATLTVTPQTVSSITVTPPAPSIQVGQTQQFTATARDSVGNVMPNVTFTWVSSSPGVASVDANGFATAGQSAGTTMITSSAGGVTSPGAQLVVTTGGGGGRSYSTNFLSAENPISENGNWINGQAVGLDWNDVQTTPGLTHTAAYPGAYADNIAILAAGFNADQEAQAVVSISNTTSSDREAELLLRFNISAHVATGYEFSFDAGGGTDQLLIVQWLGALGSFNVIFQQSGSQYHINNGDTVKVTAIRSVLTAYINGTQVAQITDTLYTSGHPGIGFYVQGAGVAVTDVGWSSFTATD